MSTLYRDRTHAANVLAESLASYRDRENRLVLALPRGGVPIGFHVAEALGAPLDLMIVRKLGTPGREELAMGAIASGGVRVMNPDVASSVPGERIQTIVEREHRELERRERAYRGDRPFPNLSDRCIFLVDDGLATGSTMRAAIQAVREQRPSEVIVAVPVAPPATAASLRSEADEVVCPATPREFYGIGQFYRDFSQTSDDEVRELLERAWRRASAAT